MSMTFRRLRLPALITVAAVGYREITTTKTVEVRYTGPRQWWDASWAEAPRLAWRTIPEHARPATAATRSRFWRACGKTTAACCATSRWVTRRPAARTEPRREPRRAGTGRRTVRPRRYRRAGRRIRTRLDRRNRHRLGTRRPGLPGRRALLVLAAQPENRAHPRGDTAGAAAKVTRFLADDPP